MSRSLSLAVPLPLRCAVLLLALVAGTRHGAPAEYLVRGEDLPVQPVYWIAPQSNFSKEPLSGPHLIMLRAGIERRLGRERCRMASESQAEIERDIEKDRRLEALYIEIKRTPPRPKVVLWATCKDHAGKIAEFPCDPATGERCVEYALRDFAADVSSHDDMCHRGKPCRVDASYFIVP